jgi:hypothetical protein
MSKLKTIHTPVGDYMTEEGRPPQWVCPRCSYLGSDFGGLFCRRGDPMRHDNPFRHHPEHWPPVTDGSGIPLVIGNLYHFSYGAMRPGVARYLGTAIDSRGIHVLQLEVVWQLRNHCPSRGHDTDIGKTYSPDMWGGVCYLSRLDPLWFGLVYNDLVTASRGLFQDLAPARAEDGDGAGDGLRPHRSAGEG